jgi:hypothetical protein
VQHSVLAQLCLEHYVRTGLCGWPNNTSACGPCRIAGQKLVLHQLQTGRSPAMCRLETGRTAVAGRVCLCKLADS